MAEVTKGASKEIAPVRAGVLSRGHFNSLYPLHMQHGLLNFHSNRILLQDIFYYLAQAFQMQNCNCVAILTMLGAGKEYFQFSAAARISFPENNQALCVTYPTSYSLGTGDLSREYSGRAVKRTAYFHLVPRSRTTLLVQVLHLMPSRLNK